MVGGGGGVSQIILRHLLAPRLDTCWWCLISRNLLVVSHNKTVAGVLQQDTYWCLITRQLLVVSHNKTLAGVSQQNNCWCLISRHLVVVFHIKTLTDVLQQDTCWYHKIGHLLAPWLSPCYLLTRGRTLTDHVVTMSLTPTDAHLRHTESRLRLRLSSVLQRAVNPRRRQSQRIIRYRNFIGL